MGKNNKKMCIEACANCKYWYYYHDEKQFDKFGEVSEGECRRFPPSVPCIDSVTDLGIPVPELTKMTPLMTNPFTFAGGWCGEFKPAKKLRWTN